jgi:Ribbon-helix-helix protein, copG family
MTMLSFRVGDDEAAEAQVWADRLGVDRSEFLREALHRHLVALRSQREGDRYEQVPVSESELALGEIADWGPAEDWADWADGLDDEPG